MGMNLRLSVMFFHFLSDHCMDIATHTCYSYGKQKRILQSWGVLML